MTGGWRSTVLFAAGLLAGGAAVLAVYLGWMRPTDEVRTQPLPYVTAPAQTLAQPVANSSTPETATPVASCPSQPLAAAASTQDGQFALEAALASRSHADPSAFVAVAREAAEQGRVRDTEVALIAACHIAERSSGGASAPVADLKSQLAQQYVAQAAHQSSDEARDQLLQRASALFGESASAYAAALGKNASKTRMAQQNQASLADPNARAMMSRARPIAPPPIVGVPPPPAPDTGRLGAARSTSLVERPPLRTEELQQVDHDLERLYNQARAVSRDPSGLQRRHQQALAQRSACRGDEGCLRNWYAQRKRQLFAEF
jgi:hypothetical protein